MKIRYSRDCEILANKISSESNCRLSASTIRRLFGFIKTQFTPRTYSLDVIANFLGYSEFDELIHSLNTEEKRAPKIITELKSSEIKQGWKYQYACKPNIDVTIEYMGKSKFKVLKAKNSQLKPDDVFKASILTLHHPLFILEVEREGKPLGKIIEAKVSGITSIKKI